MTVALEISVLCHWIEGGPCVVRIEWECEVNYRVLSASLCDPVVVVLPSFGVSFVSEGTVSLDRAMVSLDEDCVGHLDCSSLSRSLSASMEAQKSYSSCSSGDAGSTSSL